MHIESKEQSEFEDFLTRMKEVPEYQEQLMQIIQFIKIIGVKYGANPHHFKHERSAEALPPPYYIQPGQPNRYGIRLYCIRLGRGAVVLLNGDLKTHNDPEQCPKCKSISNLLTH